MSSLTAAGLARLLGEWNVGAAAAYRELADVVRLLVLDGRVALDTALPSERALSDVLGVSRTTVTAAYGLLRDQGFLTGGQGSRSRTRIPPVTPAGTTVFTGPARKDPALTAPGLAAPEGLIDLAYASLPASGEVVHRAFAAALTELPALLPGFGYDAIGLLPLREAVAARYTAAGAPTTADQILVTSGRNMPSTSSFAPLPAGRNGCWWSTPATRTPSMPSGRPGADPFRWHSPGAGRGGTWTASRRHCSSSGPSWHTWFRTSTIQRAN